MHIFFHVPKAAGTTVREQIREQIGAQKVLSIRGAGGLSFLSDDAINSMDLVSGHVGIDLLKRIHIPYRAISFLRHPIQRVFSQYRYTRMLAIKGDAFLPGGIDSKITWLDRRSFFLQTLDNILQDQEAPVVESMFRNTQAWFFAADWAAGNRNRSLSDANVLEIAKESIQEKLDCFGLVEEMDISFRLINKCFNWDLQNGVNLNASKKDGQELTPKLATLIEEHNQIDIELYIWAKKLFHERCQQWLGGEKIILTPNNFSGSGWLNGIRTEDESNTFYFLAPSTSELTISPGDVVEFAATGKANIVRIEPSRQNGVLSVFVTVDRPIDPIGDGYPNKVFVQSKVIQPL